MLFPEQHFAEHDLEAVHREGLLALRIRLEGLSCGVRRTGYVLQYYLPEVEYPSWRDEACERCAPYFLLHCLRSGFSTVVKPDFRNA